MSDSGDVLPTISFAFEYAGHGWARASIANGVETYYMHPSYVGGDPLFWLVRAVVAVLREGDQDSGCEWWYEPALDRWHLHRQGDTLRITIRGRRDGTPDAGTFEPAWFWSSPTAGVVRFRTTCDLWAFAAQVRDAVRQLKPRGEGDENNPRRMRRTAEYRALRELLDEHARAEGQPSRMKPM